MTTQSCRVLIIYHPDGFANSVKPSEITKYLSALGVEVDMYPTLALARAGRGRFTRRLPGRTIPEIILYVYEIFYVVLGMNPSIRKRSVRLRSRLVFEAMRRRGALLSKILCNTNYHAIICESNMDASFVTHARLANVQILDLPVPFGEELYYANEIDAAGFERIRSLEVEMYRKADYLSFHWHTYAEFVRSHKYDGPNFLPLTYGTHRKAIRARYSETPRVVFLGLLSGHWVNLPLLERLCALYPAIDLYGGPEPPPNLRNNYRGYAPSLDVLAEYQFGLITISDDPLRRSSFSSKHLEYISYGLPVLTPKWRRDAVLDPSSIYYSEEFFLETLLKYRDKDKWTAKSNEALQLSNSLTWEEALRPLGKLVGIREHRDPDLA